MITVLSGLTGFEPPVIRGVTYAVVGLIAGAALWGRDISEFIAWALVLYLAYRLWRKDEPTKGV